MSTILTPPRREVYFLIEIRNRTGRTSFKSEGANSPSTASNEVNDTAVSKYLAEVHLFGEFPIEIRKTIWELAFAALGSKNVYLREGRAFIYDGQYTRVRSDVDILTAPRSKKQMRTAILRSAQVNRLNKLASLGDTIAAHMQWYYPHKRSLLYPLSHLFDEAEEGKLGTIYGKTGYFDVGESRTPKTTYLRRVLGGEDSDWIQIEYEEVEDHLVDSLIGWTRTRKLPGVLLACGESFNLASTFRLSFPSFGTLGENYLNPKQDILVIDNESTVHRLRNLFCLSGRE